MSDYDVTEIEVGVSDPIQVIKITNPFNPKDQTKELVEWESHKTIDTYVPELEEGYYEWVVSLNGGIIEAEDYSRTYVTPGSTIAICPIPQKGGKNLFRLIAMIAVSVIAGPLAAGLGSSLGISSGIGLGLLKGAISIAGSMLVNALLPPPKPAAPNKSDYDSSPSYGIDGAKNASAENIPVPIHYGTFRGGGNFINIFVENVEDTQFLYMLLNAGEGEVYGLSDIKINDQPIENFQDYELAVRTGRSDQEYIDWFLDVITPFNLGIKLTPTWVNYTTSGLVDKLRVDVVFPTGLFALHEEKGTLLDAEVDIELQYRKVGEQTWQAGTTNTYVAHYNHIYHYYEQCQWDDEETQICTPGYSPAELETGDYEGTGSDDGLIIREGEDDDYPVGTYEKIPVYVSGLKIKEKNRSPVRQSISTPVLEQAQYEVRVRRVTEESTGQFLFDSVTLSDINEVLVEDIRYKNTALMGVKIRLSDQLNGIPKVTYINQGRRIRTWDEANSKWVDGDATQKNNPAWVVYDLMTNDRYGAGISSDRIDVEKFKIWAKHCKDNNLTFDGVIDTHMNMWDALQPILRTGHAQIVNVGTRYTVAIERAENPVMMFSVSNIIKDSFSIEWLPLEGRANTVEVSYFDKNDDYKQRTIKLYDATMQPGEPERIAQVKLIGVVDPQTAAKEARFHLNMNKYILQSVSFDAAVEAIACTVGDLIYVQHDIPQWGYAGRTEAACTDTIIKLDRPVTMETGKAYKALVLFDYVALASGTVASIVNNTVFLNGYDGNANAKRIQINTVDYEVENIAESGGVFGVVINDATGILPGNSYTIYNTDVIEERDVVLNVGEQTEITVTSAFPAAPAQFVNWMFGENGKFKKPFRVNSIEGTGEYTRTISAIEYNASVYDLSGAAVPTPDYSALSGGGAHVTNLSVTEELFLIGSIYRTRITVHYDPPANESYKEAEVHVASNGVSYEFKGSGRFYTSFDADQGAVLSIKVVAKDALGKPANFSTAPVIEHTVQGKSIVPGDVTNLVAVESGGVYTLTWDHEKAIDHAYYEIQHNAATIGTSLEETAFTTVKISSLEQQSFTVRAVDTSNNVSSWATVVISPGAPAGVSNLTATEVNGNFALTWNHTQPDDFAAYEISTPTLGVIGTVISEQTFTVNVSAFAEFNDKGVPIEFVVNVIDTLGLVSPDVSVYGTPTLPDSVLNFSAKTISDGVFFSWDEVVNVSVKGYEIRKGGPLWDTAEVVATNITTNSYYLFDSEGVDLSETYLIKAIRETGEYSQNYTSVGFTEDGVVVPDVGDTEGYIYKDETLEVTFDDSEGNYDVQFTYKTYDDPNIIAYEMRIGETFEHGEVVTQSTTDTISVPFTTVSGKKVWIKAVYADGEGYSAWSYYVDLTEGAGVETPTGFHWTIDEINIILEWDEVEGADHYLVYYSDGGVTRIFKATDPYISRIVPKYTLNVNIVAVDSDGLFSLPLVEEITLSGRYRLNEIVNINLPMVNGKYVNLCFTSDSTVRRASVAGSAVSLPILNINDCDLFTFANDLDGVTTSSIEDTSASWFRQDFWKEKDGYFESGILDLGAILTGKLKLALTTTINNLGDLISDIDDVAVEYLADSSVLKLIDRSAYVGVKFYVNPTDDVLSGQWNEVVDGDWITARYVKCVIEVLEASPLTEIIVNEGTITLDVPDLIESGMATGVTSAGTAITLTKPFNVVSVVLATARGNPKAQVSNVTATGFTLKTNSATPADVDWYAKGY